MRKASLLWLWLVLFGGAQAADLPMTVPVEFSHGRMILLGRIGETGSLRFLLDSGCTIPTLHPALMDQLKLSPSGRVRIQGIAGVERAPTYRGIQFKFGDVSYAPERVAVVPSERARRRGRDGVLDAGFFRQFVIEVLREEKTLKLHAPETFVYEGAGEVVPFRLREEIPVIEVAIVLPGKESIRAEIELDTGFVRKHGLVARVDGETSEKFGVGGSVETRSGQIPVVRLGRKELLEVQTDFFLDGSPVDEPLAGHIGMSALGQHKIIFDYQRKRLIIE
jgi:hypothetical protein